MKVDLHCHSMYSSRPSDWILQKLGTQESYTDPKDLYKILKLRGMDAITITDHNTIEGCLEIANLPDTFISCEYTSYFPEDRCKVHVLCWDITPEIHNQIQKLRKDIYKLKEYLQKNNINHGLAHPLYSVNGKLNEYHIDKLVDMFDLFELNGCKDEYTNQYLELILETVKKDKYALTGGSDDHSGLLLGNMYTYCKASSIKEFFECINSKKCNALGKGSTPHTLARTIYSIGLQHLIKKKKADSLPDILRKYLLPPEYKVEKSLSKKLWEAARLPTNVDSISKKIALSWLKHEFAKIDLFALRHLTIEEQWFEVLEQITNRHFLKFGNKLIDDLNQVEVMDMFTGLGIAGFLYTILSPYFAAFTIFGEQRKLARKLLQKYRPEDIYPIKIAKLTDNFCKIDGVSKTLLEQIVEAKKSGKDYTIITCVGKDCRNLSGVKYFEPIGIISAPEYAEQPLVWPPFLRILDYCYEEQFTHVQTATPGPMGLVAMLVSKTLGIGYHATYHTEIPKFIWEVTEANFLEDLAWKYIVWFYNSADVVFSPSEFTKNNLIAHGIKEEKIKVYPRGIDINLFNPDKKEKQYWYNTWNVPEGVIKFLYVGRVSKEKGLDLLSKTFVDLVKEYKITNIHLIIVGNGDYFNEMKGYLDNNLNSEYFTFTGFLDGDELTKAFASADVFVFPSTNDTHGRVVLEALASGVPCIITDVGGPKENIQHEKTGYIVEANNVNDLIKGFNYFIKKLENNDLESMKKATRKYAETKSFKKAFEEYWKMY